MIRQIISEKKKNDLTYKNLQPQQISKSFYTQKQNKINKPSIHIKSNNPNNTLNLCNPYNFL